MVIEMFKLVICTVTSLLVLITGLHDVAIGQAEPNDRNSFIEQCGQVIAHENGFVNFNPLTYCHSLGTCPAQLAQIQKYNKTVSPNRQLKFAKLSIRTLKDGSWVVAHNDDQYIMPEITSKSPSNMIKSSGLKYLTLKVSSPVNGSNLKDIAVYKIDSPQTIGSTQYKNLLGSNVSITSNFVTKIIKRGEKIPLLKKNQGQLIGVVPIDAINEIQLKNLTIIKVTLSKIDTKQYNQYKEKYGKRFPVFRFSDYAKVVQSISSPQVCLMLYFKTNINKYIFHDVSNAMSQSYVIFESRNNDDARNIQQHYPQFYYTGRTYNESDLQAILKNTSQYPNMKLIEISGGDRNNISNTKFLVSQAKKAGFPTEVDAMPYSITQHEILHSACSTPLKVIGSTSTMTNRPVDCLR